MARSRHENARLDGFDAAKELHRHLSVEQRVKESGKGYIDVFDIIEELDIPFAFKPLDKVLGFALPYPKQGIVVTTERNLHLQRYTAAHELGHCWLKHEGSIDTEILLRGGHNSQRSIDIKEVEAEAFAAEFLLPRWLYIHHMREQGWSIHNHLQNPDVVYQLSLRMNVSYEATCWGLLNNDLVQNRTVLNFLRKNKPAAIKAETLKPVKAKIGHSDVWAFTEKDSSKEFASQAGDYYRFDLPELGGRGYEWDVEALEQIGLTILNDRNIGLDLEKFGSGSVRQIVTTAENKNEIEVLLRESRPWETDVIPKNVFGVFLNRLGSEVEGMSRARRKRLGISVT